MDEAEQQAQQARRERFRLAERRWAAETLVGELAMALRRHHREHVRRFGLREVEMAAVQLVDRREGLSMTALAERLGLSRAATTAIVDRLVALERVVRWRDEGDRRRMVVVAITRPESTPPWRRLVADLERRQEYFSDDELHTVARWVAVMRDELHRRAGDLGVERAGREAWERRRRAYR